jgi:hypothetical protein
MKNNLYKNLFAKIATAIVLLSLFVYSSCKKSENSSGSTTPVNTSDIAKQVALNFYKSMTGANNAVNVNNGIKLQSPIGGKNAANQNLLCGYVADTAYSVNTKSGDTSTTMKTRFTFTYTCATNYVNGYKLDDTVSSTSTGTLFRSNNYVGQHYVVTALDSTYKKSAMNGSINTGSEFYTLGTNGATKGFHDVYAQYKLTNVTVDASTGTADFISGSATFHMLITDLNPAVNPDNTVMGYTGSITYLGNFTARLSIQVSGSSTKNYLVNLLTGSVTQQ